MLKLKHPIHQSLLASFVHSDVSRGGGEKLRQQAHHITKKPFQPKKLKKIKKIAAILGI
jgi:hypothetical protein